ncbi:phosphatidate cytidylyltransferase [Chloroflexota bacterium]
MLKKRVITSLGILPLLVCAVWFDKPLPWFTALVAIWGLLAAYEFYTMGRDSRVPVLTGFGLLWVLLSILSPHFNDKSVIPLLLTTAVLLPLIWLLLRPQKDQAFIHWAWTIAGILYIGWLLSYLIALRGLDDGRNWVFFTLFVTFGSDIAAFLVGRAAGKHRLAPQISPAKTWEGAIAGISGAIIVSLLFLLPTPLGLPLTYGRAILLGIAVSISGQIGDLLESLLKRNMGVKDSGKLMPGHGGALDRIDSIVLAGVVVYYYVLLYNSGWL